MSLAAYALSLALLAASAAGPLVAAVALRRRLLPGWSGAPARLAEVVAALAVVVVVSELLGAVGAFRVEAFVPASLLAGVALTLVARRLPRPAATVAESTAPETPAPGRTETWISLAGALLVLAQWAVPARLSLGQGMTAPDTLWYHMPFAARFVQDGSLTQLHYVEVEPLTAFFPANSELLHALGIALFDGHDVLSPSVNLGMVALALLAGWCIGRAYGTPLALLGTAIALSLPILWGVNAGQAGNDVTGLAFALAAVALLALARERDGERAAVALAALAAGLALGTKLSLAGPALTLAVAAVAVAPRGRRLRRAGTWALGLAATGGFWYARNLVRAGSPLPTLSFHLGPLGFTAPPRPLTEQLELPLAHYLLDTDVWRSHLLPGLRFGFGWIWWAVVALAAAGAIGAVLARGDRLRRALGLAALAWAVLYAVTPNSAAGREGDPWSFGLNLRYATPAVALGLALLPAWLARRPAWRRPLAAALAATLALTLLAPTGLWSYRRLEALAYAAAGALAVLVVILLRRRRPRRALLASVGATGAAVLLAGGFVVQRHYLDNRYPRGGDGAPPTFEFARGLSHQRIGVVGATVHYQLYGGDLSNRVIYVGRRGAHGAFTREPSCAAWRDAVNRGRFHYLVVAPVSSPDLPAETPSAPPVETRWTAGDPAAVPVYRFRGLVTVFRIEGVLDPRGCA